MANLKKSLLRKGYSEDESDLIISKELNKIKESIHFSLIPLEYDTVNSFFQDESEAQSILENTSFQDVEDLEDHISMLLSSAIIGYDNRIVNDDGANFLNFSALSVHFTGQAAYVRKNYYGKYADKIEKIKAAIVAVLNEVD